MRASRAVPQRIVDLAVVLKGTASDPLAFGSTSAPLSSARSGARPSLSRRTCKPGILHDILDQLWGDHPPEPVHSPFQHPTQQLHGRLAWLQELHVSQEHGVSNVFSQLFQAWSACAYGHCCVHRDRVHSGPVRPDPWSDGSNRVYVFRSLRRAQRREEVCRRSA